MISPEERQLIIHMLKQISDPTPITKLIDDMTTIYEEQRELLLKSLNVCDYSKDRIQKTTDPDLKMLSLISQLESLEAKHNKDIEPLYRIRGMYIDTRTFLEQLPYYPVADLMQALYIKHSKEKDIRIQLGLNIQEFNETHDEGIEAVSQFMKSKGYSPE